MKAIFGLILAAGGAWAAWWAFKEAEAGDNVYNLVGMGAVFVCIIGLILIFMRFRKWWMSE